VAAHCHQQQHTGAQHDSCVLDRRVLMSGLVGTALLGASAPAHADELLEGAGVQLDAPERQPDLDSIAERVQEPPEAAVAPAGEVCQLQSFFFFSYSRNSNCRMRPGWWHAGALSSAACIS
jgi:hypothetical protein